MILSLFLTHRNKCTATIALQQSTIALQQLHCNICTAIFALHHLHCNICTATLLHKRPQTCYPYFCNCKGILFYWTCLILIYLFNLCRLNPSNELNVGSKGVKAVDEKGLLVGEHQMLGCRTSACHSHWYPGVQCYDLDEKVFGRKRLDRYNGDLWRVPGWPKSLALLGSSINRGDLSSSRVKLVEPVGQEESDSPSLIVFLFSCLVAFASGLVAFASFVCLFICGSPSSGTAAAAMSRRQESCILPQDKCLH